MRKAKFTKEDLDKLNFKIPYVEDEDNFKFDKMFPSGLNENLNNIPEEKIDITDQLQIKAIENIKSKLNARELKILNWLQEGTGSNRKIAKVLDVGRMSIQRDKERIWAKIRKEYAKFNEEKDL
jgi:DNA-directed RNA polymerase specialized sigma subunit